MTNRVDVHELRTRLVDLAAAGDPVAWTWLHRLDGAADPERRHLLEDLAGRLERFRAVAADLPPAGGAVRVTAEEAQASVDRVLGPGTLPWADAWPSDPDASLCWRCDTAPGQGRAGLCSPCATELRG